MITRSAARMERGAALAFEVRFCSTAGNVGCSFWSHDVGRHKGERNQEAMGDNGPAHARNATLASPCAVEAPVSIW